MTAMLVEQGKLRWDTKIGEVFRELRETWILRGSQWAGGKALTHNGSNTMFFATIWMAPARDAVFVAATNCAGKAAQEATDAAISAMIAKVLK